MYARSSDSVPTGSRKGSAPGSSSRSELTDPPGEDELLPPFEFDDILAYKIPFEEPTEPRDRVEPVLSVVVVTDDELNRRQLDEIKNNISMKENRIYKNKYDSYNGKYIIEALRKAPVNLELEKPPIYEGEGEFTEFLEEEEGELTVQDEEEPITSLEEMEDEFIDEEGLEEKYDYESEEYDFRSDSDEDDDYEDNAPTVQVPLTPKERLLFAGLQEMEHRNARRIKKEINMLKILYSRNYETNILLLEAAEEEQEEEELEAELEGEELGEETEMKYEEEEKGESREYESKYSLMLEALGEDEMYEIEKYEVEEEEIEKFEAESIEEEYPDLDLLPISQLNVHLYRDDISLYEVDAYKLTDDDLRGMDANLNALRNYDFPMLQTDYYRKDNPRAANFDEFKLFLDILNGPLPKLHKMGTLSYQKGYRSHLTSLKRQRRFLDVKNKKKRNLHIRYTDINQNGRLDTYEMRVLGRPTPRDLLGPPRTAASFILEKQSQIYKETLTSIEAHKSSSSILPLMDRTHVSYVDSESQPEVHETTGEWTLQRVIAEYAKADIPVIKDAISPDCELFHIVSTLSDRSQSKYDLGPCTDESKYFLMRSCCTVIFDISRSRHDITEAWYYLKQYMELMDKKEMTDNSKSERPRHLILITNFLTWDKSIPAVKEEINEENFLKRNPHPDYLDYFTLENFVYKIGQNLNFGLKTTIIYTGIPYGHEQDIFLYLFKMAWDNEIEIPLFTSGKNIPPLIHVNDLANVVVQTINRHLYPPIVFAVAPNTNTLLEIARGISKKLGNGKIVKRTSKEFDEKMCIPQIVYDLLRQNIKHDNVKEPATIAHKYLNPFENNIKEILHEIKTQRNLNEVTIMFLGPPSKIKFELALLMSKFYEIPLFHKDNIVEKYVEMQEALGLKETKGEDEEEEEEEEDEVEEEEALLKKERDDFDQEIFALKKFVDTKATNQSNKYLAKCLKKLLTTTHVKNHGYVLVDFPVREVDAMFLFSDSPTRKANEDEDDIEIKSYVTFPEYIFITEGPTDYVDKDYIYCNAMDVKDHDDFLGDLDEYKYYRSTYKSVRDYIERMNHRVFPFNISDGVEIINKMVTIIGIPQTNKGAAFFGQYVKHLNTFNPYDRYAEKTEKYLERFFRAAEDFNETISDQPFTRNVYSLREFNLNNPCQTYYMNERYDCTPIQDVMRSKKPRYYTLKRHWGRSKTFENELPTSHPRNYWKLLRKYWTSGPS